MSTLIWPIWLLAAYFSGTTEIQSYSKLHFLAKFSYIKPAVDGFNSNVFVPELQKTKFATIRQEDV